MLPWSINFCPTSYRQLKLRYQENANNDVEDGCSRVLWRNPVNKYLHKYKSICDTMNGIFV